ncbi:MAG: hypothetical protein HYT72_01475 [Candidatus Aenigmarchaeota archaeon]|nr:hypothetical protein [Candidatus Aenigmarchaeota archaeon]
MVDIFGFAINISVSELLIFVIIFVLFLVITRKIVRVIMSLLWIAIASAIFPFAMRFLGLDFSTDLNSVLFYVALGIGLYFVYMLGRIVYVILGLAGKSSKFITYPIKSARKRKEERTKKKMEKLVKEKSKGKEG